MSDSHFQFAATIFLIHTLTPLHAGTGQVIGTIDLPIAREKATGIPYLPGSSLKGVLRDRAQALGWDQDTLFAVFGPDTPRASDHVGALQLGDAKLLVLPVRSLYGVFALVTSPYVLERFRREAALVGLNMPNVVPLAEKRRAVVAPGSVLKEENRIFLEDLDLEVHEASWLQEWEEWLSKRTEAPVRGRLALVYDDLMAFLLETATEVVARIRLDDETKTVAKGALWYEENLPAESLLYSLVRAEGSRRRGKDLAAERILGMAKGLLEGALQLGGKSTIGRGLCRITVGG